MRKPDSTFLLLWRYINCGLRFYYYYYYFGLFVRKVRETRVAAAAAANKKTKPSSVELLFLVLWLEENSVGFIQNKHSSVPSLDKTKQVLHFFLETKFVLSLLNFDFGGFTVEVKWRGAWSEVLWWGTAGGDPRQDKEAISVAWHWFDESTQLTLSLSHTNLFLFLFYPSTGSKPISMNTGNSTLLVLFCFVSY